MTIFRCNVYNTSIIKQITINTKTCSSHQLLKKEIADHFKLNTNQFELTNLPPENKLKKNEGKYDITLKIKTPSPNILFKFANETILINNCFQKDYNGITQQFHQQNIFFSSFLLSILKFKIWDIEIPRFHFLFNCIPEGTIVDVEPHNLIILNYRYFKFICIEGESVSSVLQLISGIIKGSTYYTLQSLPDCTTLHTSYQLSSMKKYVVHITYIFTFCQINGRPFEKQFDFLTTVSELKNTFSVSFQLKPANIIVYNYKFNQFARDNDRLIDVFTFSQEIGKFVVFFDISYNIQSQFLPIPSLPPQQQPQPQQNLPPGYYQQPPQTANQQQNQQNLASSYSQHPTNSSSYNRRMSTSDGIEIHFIFDNGSGIDFTENALFETKIDTLIKSITAVYKLTGKVEIAYKDNKTNKTVVMDRSKTVVEYINEMKSYGENRLYIETEIKENQKQKKNLVSIPPRKRFELKSKSSNLCDEITDLTERKIPQEKIEYDNFKSKFIEIEKENTKLKKENKNLRDIILKKNKLENELKNEISNLKKINQEIHMKEEESVKHNHELEETIFQLKTNIEKEKLEREQQNALKKITPINVINSSEYEHIQKIKEIGRGATSTVFEVSKSHNYALKILSPQFCMKNDDEDEDDVIIDEDKIKNFFTEYEILNQLNHPNIIKVYGIYMGDASNMPSILLEFCPTNLKRSMKKLSNEERVQIIIEISSAMKIVHSMKIIHRDLKPENILLDSTNHVKICDFGLCKLLNPEEQNATLSQVAGTLKYMAPELIQERSTFNEKVDVYSFGVIYYQILMKGEFPNISIADFANGKIAPIPTIISKFSSNLIKQCWSNEPNDRPSFETICDILKLNKNKII